MSNEAINSFIESRNGTILEWVRGILSKEYRNYYIVERCDDLRDTINTARGEGIEISVVHNVAHGVAETVVEISSPGHATYTLKMPTPTISGGPQVINPFHQVLYEGKYEIVVDNDDNLLIQINNSSLALGIKRSELKAFISNIVGG